MDREEAIDLFRSITSSSLEQATFFVESAKGDLDVRVTCDGSTCDTDRNRRL